ncbi:MAG: hypothetical protein H6Q68_4081 [Firmicutes bacterium]|nr:hypothetical protein [Bacillota bacterium]
MVLDGEELLLLLSRVVTVERRRRMKVFVWRHNRKFHSWSMIDEPNVHQDFYTDAIAVVVAATVDEALDVLAKERGWVLEEVRRIEPQVYELDKPKVLLQVVHGS